MGRLSGVRKVWGGNGIADPESSEFLDTGEGVVWPEGVSENREEKGGSGGEHAADEPFLLGTIACHRDCRR